MSEYTSLYAPGDHVLRFDGEVGATWYVSTFTTVQELG